MYVLIRTTLNNRRRFVASTLNFNSITNHKAVFRERNYPGSLLYTTMGKGSPVGTKAKCRSPWHSAMTNPRSDNKRRDAPSENGGVGRAIGRRDETKAVKLQLYNSPTIGSGRCNNVRIFLLGKWRLVVSSLVGTLLICNHLYNRQSPPLQDSTILRGWFGQTEGVLPSS